MGKGALLWAALPTAASPGAGRWDDRSVQVRWAGAHDAAGIAEVHVRSWQEGYRGLLPQAQLDALEPAQRIARWTTALTDGSWPSSGTLVVDAEVGVVDGFAHAKDDVVFASVPSRDVRYRRHMGRKSLGRVSRP